MKFIDTTASYRIGGGSVRDHWAHRWHVDIFFRSWQSEAPDVCRFARRGWTPGMARWLMERDRALALRGRISLHQRCRTWWANRRCLPVDTEAGNGE